MELIRLSCRIGAMAAFEALQRCLDHLASALGPASPHARLLEETTQAVGSALAEHQSVAAKVSVYEDAASARCVGNNVVYVIGDVAEAHATCRTSVGQTAHGG